MDQQNQNEWVSKEEYDELLRKYNKVNMELYNFKCRKTVRLIRKIDLKLEKINIYGKLNKVLQKTGIPKVFFNNFIIKKADKLSFEEYKFYKYKRERVNKYYLDSTKIKHHYEKDLISIVMPVYNCEKYIAKSIDSILRQTYSNFELIIVNDGSTDDTNNILKQYANKDKRIVIINQENQTLPCAISNGFSKACGEYYMWVGADDVLHDNCLKFMLDDLKKDERADYVFPNVRLIDENDKPIINNCWLAKDEEHPEKVMLPHNMLKLCTFKDNTIAPICLYKSLVVKTLAPFSKNRFTVEDYDYWMRVNDLFIIKHTDSDETIFDYRRHKDTLTSHAKELDIDRKTRILMLWEAFREDFYLMPLLWVIDKPEEHQELVSIIENRGHMIINSEKANSLVLNDIYNNMVYVHFDSNDMFKNIPDSAYKVVLCNEQFKGSKADLYITINTKKEIKEIDYQKGFFAIEDYNTIFSFIDTKAKEYFLRRIEDYVEDRDRKELHPVSAVVVTYKRTEKVPIVLESLLKQSEPRENYEILVVNNDIFTNEIKELVEEIREKYNLSDQFLRYVEAPIKGVSYARNVGAFEARGDIIHWLDDDSISDYNNIHEMRNAFKEKTNAAVIGGNIILKKPNPVPEVILEGKEKLWSQYIVDGTEMVKVTKWFLMPYGANYATIKKDLLRVGGFRLCYGRVGHNWIGGEETASSALIRRLGKDVYMQPKAIVYHDPQYHRYSFEHVKNTLNAGPRTIVKLEQDMIINPEYHNIDAQKRYYKYNKKQVRKYKNKVERFYFVQDLEGHRLSLIDLRKEINERIKALPYRESMLKFIKNNEK